MCGICGIVHLDRERTVDRLRLEKMTDAIIHRGPDGSGYFLDDSVGLGHRRLSIIDLNTGDQPMYSVDKDIVLIFNGEIYNYVELTEELKKLGHRFRTNSDSEVIINAYKQWGVDCQTRFNGMWSFAIWDCNTKSLFLSRDRIGEKPLYFTIQDDTLLFASEIKSLLAYGTKAEPNLEFLELYLYLGFVPSPYTFYKGIRQLNPGTCLILKDQQITERKYWDLPEINEKDLVTDKTVVHEQFKKLFMDSVRLRMRSDVPFGAFLSGGLDSTSIVSIMSDISNYPVETFTIGFNEKSYDERTLAKEVAEMYRTSHHETVVEPKSFEYSLDLVLKHFDEPFSDPAAIPTGIMSEYARNSVKMVLTGDGGDEVLSGYKAFRGEKFANMYQHLPAFVRQCAPGLINRVSANLKGDLRYKLNRVNKILTFANGSFINRIVSKNAIFEPYTPKHIVAGNGIKIEDFMEGVLAECRFSDPFYKLMFLQFKLFLPDQMLVKVDRMAMAFSLETRAPFLDPRLIENMYQVHKDIKLPFYQTKTILRNTFKNNLPKSILKAPKSGFNVPLKEWFKSNSFDNEWNKMQVADAGVDSHLIKKIVEDNQNGKVDYGHFIYRLMVYFKWIAKF